MTCVKETLTAKMTLDLPDLDSLHGVDPEKKNRRTSRAIMAISGQLPIARKPELHDPPLLLQELYPGSRLVVRVDAKKPESTLRWRFRCENGGSIDMMIMKKKINSDPSNETPLSENLISK